MRKYQWLAYINDDIPLINNLIDVAENTCRKVCSHILNLDAVPEMHIKYLAMYTQSSYKVQVCFRTSEHDNMWIGYFTYSDIFGWMCSTDTDNMVSSYRCRIRDYVQSR